LKIRVLDALGCAMGALEAPPVRKVLRVGMEFEANGRCTLIGGGRMAPDRAAFYNGALVRYLDFNDSFLAKGETCHPSDNVAPVLGASEFSNASGREFLVSLAMAYQVQCRLSEVAPVRSRGFDHTTQGAYAVAAGVSRALGLDAASTANAISISGTSFNSLRVTRTGRLSNWKGLAYPFTSSCATNAVFLAKEGITGPLEVFEGNKGFMDTISGPFKIDWGEENLEIVSRTILKKYNAEIHSQSAIDCILQLRNEDGIQPKEVTSIDVDIFDVAYNIIGGGEGGQKNHVRTKEEADHSLPYILSAALLDGEVTPTQYKPQRISRKDVQTLLRKVRVSPDKRYSARFPEAMPCRITVHLAGGRRVEREVDDYEGFFTRPMPWETVLVKFNSLASPFVSRELRGLISGTVARLEEAKVRELTKLLGRVRRPGFLAD
jgi:2-methylcitrate dehydratase